MEDIMQGPVDAQRFAQGLTYAEYLAQMSDNRQHFERSYREFDLGADEARFFAGLNETAGPVRVLVIGEDWCPDVQRGVPVMARIAEASGMELRIFPRDKNPDLMDLYLKEGKYASIPVFAFFDQAWQALGHWIERPAVASSLMDQMKSELARANLSEAETKAEIKQRVAGLWDDWRRETVRELRELLSKE